MGNLYPTGWAHWPKSMADLLPKTCWWRQIKVPDYPRLSAQTGRKWNGSVDRDGNEEKRKRKEKGLPHWQQMDYIVCLSQALLHGASNKDARGGPRSRWEE